MTIDSLCGRAHPGSTLLRLAGLWLLAVPLIAGAAEGDHPSLDFDAFGTLGVVHSSEDQADYPRSFVLPRGAGASEAWSAKVDTLVAGQVTATLSPRFSAVLQVISEYRYDNTFRPRVEWANVKFQLTPDLSLRVGRTASQMFSLTEVRRIGYALPWIRPPPELYDLVPVTSNDGVDLSWRSRIGTATNTLAFSIGQNDSDSARALGVYSVTEVRNSVNLVETYERGSLTLRANWGHSRISLAALDGLFAGFRQFGPQGQAIADQYQLKNAWVIFQGVAASYDPGNWFAMGEWGQLNTDQVLGVRTGWYLSGGKRLAGVWRFGTLTPFATYAKVGLDSDKQVSGLDLSRLPPQLVAPAAGLNGALNSIRASAPDQTTQTLGARLDFRSNMAFTLQYDRIDHERGNGGRLVNIQPGFRPGGSVDLFSFAISFVL